MRTKAVKPYNKLEVTKLKFLRAKTGLSIKEFAKKAGINVSGYSELENSRKKARIETLVKIATALNVDVTEILYLYDDPSERIKKASAASVEKRRQKVKDLDPTIIYSAD